MSEQGHDFRAEFPASGEVIHRLKLGNAHFRAVYGRYHSLMKEIGRLEDLGGACCDTHLSDLKRERLVLLDEVAELVRKGESHDRS